MPLFDLTLLGGCNKPNCPQACGFAFVNDKIPENYLPTDPCGVCGCPIGAHIRRAPEQPKVDTEAKGQQSQSPPSTEARQKTQSNKVDSTAFAGTTRDSLFASRPGGDQDPKPAHHPPGAWKKAPPTEAFRDASKARNDKRHKAAVSQGLGGALKFDPSEKIIVDKLANKTGRPGPKKKPAEEEDTRPRIVTVNPDSGNTSRSSFEILQRPGNDYVREVQINITDLDNAEAFTAAVYEKFAKVWPAEHSTNPKELFHTMDVIQPESRGMASMLMVNTWVQDDRACFRTIRGSNSRHHPSSMNDKEVKCPVYVCLTEAHKDLPVTEPKLSAPKNNSSSSKKTHQASKTLKHQEKTTEPASVSEDESKKPSSPQTRSTSKRKATEPLRESKPKCQRKETVEISDDEDIEMRSSESASGPQKASAITSTASPDLISFSKVAKRLAANTGSLADSPCYSAGYAGRGQWSTLILSSPYDLLSNVVGHSNALLSNLRNTSLGTDANLAAELMYSYRPQTEAFAHFTELAAWLDSAPLGYDFQPEQNPAFVKKFKLGPHGMTLAIEALLSLSSLVQQISSKPGLSINAYDELRIVHEELTDFGEAVTRLFQFFFQTVEPRFWYPKTGLRQLEAVIALNRPLLEEHAPGAAPLSSIHQGLSRLRSLLREDSTTEDILRAHIRTCFGHAEDPAYMEISLISRGPFGLDLLIEMIREYVQDREIHCNYDGCLAVLGKLALAVAWKTFQFLSRPKCYNQPSKREDWKRNPATGNDQPAGSELDEDLPPAPDSPDSEWYTALIIPDISCRAAFSFQPEHPSFMPGPQQQQAFVAVDPRLEKAAAFAQEKLSWTSLLNRLRTEFPHPLLSIRKRFEDQIKGEPDRRKQYLAAQLAYHPDKNQVAGEIWIQIVTQLNCAINKAYGQ
ncbi:hypothetical protein BDZ89DRAFT_1145381 [Hymenopellis radicata]|nr:hypothetical protein BDZ89DRAFT_1145381 [Hymenopellis radicata]